MSNSVCFEKFADISDDLINPSLQSISCCSKVVYHILFSSSLHFQKLHTLRQNCKCHANLMHRFVHVPSRLPKLQKIYYSDGSPVIVWYEEYPFKGLNANYLLAKNIDEMQTKTCLFMCLRKITCFDKGLIRYICSYIKQNDLIFLHVKAMEEIVAEHQKGILSIEQSLKYLKQHLPHGHWDMAPVLDELAKCIRIYKEKKQKVENNIKRWRK